MAIARAGYFRHCGWLLLVCALCGTTSGCLRAIIERPPKTAAVDDAEESADKTESDAAGEASSASLAEIERTLTTKVTRRDAATQQTTTEVVDGWYRQVGTEDEWAATPGEYRWRHNGLLALLEMNSDDRQALQTARQSEDALVRHAALVGLARLEPGQHVKELVSLARNTSLPASLRRAAVETLASAPEIETEAELRTLADRFGPNDQGVCQEPLLYGEVLAGLARHVAVDQDPAFADALASSDMDVQLAALALFAAAQTPKLPEEVRGLAKSPHARIRRAALAALVAAEHPGIVSHLRDATQDADLFVRLGAIEALGKVRDHQAVLLLYDLLRDDHERHREAAAAALVEQQEWPAVERAARDTSYRVRVAVAAGLERHGARERAPLAGQLVRDSSAMVQAKMCESLAAWPHELAVPLLFEGLASHNMLTRKAAHAALSRQQVDCRALNPGAPPAERATVLAALRENWQQQHPQSAAGEAAETASGISADEVARLVRQLQAPGDRAAQWIARKQLERLGKPVLPVLDRLVHEEKLTLEESTYRDLLPQLSDALAAIEQLRAADVSQRRTAARALAQEATIDPLPRIALERLGGIARTESDALVWADVLRAAGQSTDFVAHELALAALTQGEADIRRRACEYLAVCGDERQSEAVAALVGDRDPVVARAAVVALGRCGAPRSRKPLYALLSHDDVNLQITAAQTVARWNDPRGSAALERLALAKSPATRRLAIAAMGELADIRYLEAVMKGLDDQPSVQLVALAALPKVAGTDALAEIQPRPVSADERARAWQAWHAERR